jgi:YHS domain-containing protein
MFRKMGILIMGLVFCFAMTAAAAAAPASNEMPMMHEMHQGTTDGQTICPVSGEPVSKDSNITYTYKGKVYRFCCPACIEAFKKDPEKYIKQMGEREKGKNGKDLDRRMK